MTNTNKQVKSKTRVADHGEVFTNPREVNAMLDLVKDECERVDATFLEPACGTGNFLCEIMRRKMQTISRLYKKDQILYEKNLILATGSIYGIEILMDNVEECISNLFELISSTYTKCFRKSVSEEVKKSIYYILTHNIICGDALTMKDAGGNPIIFPEWTNPHNSSIKRRDYVFEDLIEKENQDQITVFDLEKEYDEERQVYIPNPVREYKLINYRRVYDCEEC